MRKKVGIITLQNPIPRTYFSSIHQNNEGKGIRYSDDFVLENGIFGDSGFPKSKVLL